MKIKKEKIKPTHDFGSPFESHEHYYYIEVNENSISLYENLGFSLDVLKNVLTFKQNFAKQLSTKKYGIFISLI